MLNGGFPPFYPIDKIKNNEHIKRNFSSNNILDINTIFLKKKSSSNLVNLLHLTSESDDKPNIKNRNYNNKETNDDFINFISDLTNIKQVIRNKKTSRTNKKTSRTNKKTSRTNKKN